MRLRQSAVMAGLAMGLMCGAAHAAYIINFEQVGMDVVATGSGTINLAGLAKTVFSSPTSDNGVNPAAGYAAVGSPNPNDYYSGITGPASFGSGSLTLASSGTGDVFGVLFDSVFGYPVLLIPQTYVSGDFSGISTATFVNNTISGLGLAGGTFTYSFGRGANADSFTVDVPGVPLPSSAPLFGAALMGLGAVGYGLKRKALAAASPV